MQQTTQPLHDCVFMQISESQCGRAIRTDRFKYAVRTLAPTGYLKYNAGVYFEDYLYDLEKDPIERCNLIRDPRYSHVRQELKYLLLREMKKCRRSRTCDSPRPESEEKIMNEPQKKYLTTRERICFTVGAFGRSGIYTLMSMFTLVFFQNGAGLSLSQGTTIILIGRIFDALNDPVMGMIVDRTKSKWGKMRPYLLFAPVPIAICTILLFTAPFKEGSSAAFVWALITYILWGVAFTVQDVPFWGSVLCDYPTGE